MSPIVRAAPALQYESLSPIQCHAQGHNGVRTGGSWDRKRAQSKYMAELFLRVHVVVGVLVVNLIRFDRAVHSI